MAGIILQLFLDVFKIYNMAHFVFVYLALADMQSFPEGTKSLMLRMGLPAALMPARPDKSPRMGYINRYIFLKV